MPTLDFRSRIEVPAETLFDWHARPGAFERLRPPWLNIEIEKFEGIRDGQQASFRLGLGPLRLRWVAEHRDYEEGRQFKDVQVKGPFQRWEHTHRMEPEGSEASVLHDHITYELPLDGLGSYPASWVEGTLKRQFAYRHRIVQQDLPRHRRYAPERSLRVAVSGASGLIGSHLMPLLKTGGHEVFRLVRSRPAQDHEIYWNHRTGEIEAEKLETIDAVIHLAGENVYAPRWTNEKKLRIYRSRAQGTSLISKTLAGLDDPPEALISASGLNYYGSRGDEELTEDSSPGERGFLTAVGREWEGATRPAAEAGIRTVQMRTAPILTPAGGALPLMLPPFRLGLGGTVGRKDQWFSWIVLDDVLWGYYHALMTGDLEGPVNLTAPHPVTMEGFVETLAGVLRRPAPLHFPAGLLKLIMGEVAEQTALVSLRALPKRLEATDYAFCYPELEAALRHQLGYTLEPLATGETVPSDS